MKYRLVDVIRKAEEDVQFGTCELCMYMGVHSYDIVVLEDEKGEVYEEEMGFWSWGEYFDYGPDNYVDFAAWLSNKDVQGDISVQCLLNYYEDEVYENENNGTEGDFKKETLHL